MNSQIETLYSFCKINLFLQVTGRRPDNYHTIETLFLLLDNPQDRIVINWEHPDGLDVVSDTAGVPSGPGNLIYRAAEKYAALAQIRPDWRIKLHKSIPVAAGLGGGSGNAGRVLAALESHYGILGQIRLHELAAGLGADIPFFLTPASAWGSGIGERLSRLPKARKPLHLVLANPGFPVGVKWSYSQLDASQFKPVDPDQKAAMIEAVQQGDARKTAAMLRNDLAVGLWRKFPLLALLRKAMLRSGLLAVEVSGSGPTLFGIAQDETASHSAVKALEAEFAPETGVRFFSGRSVI